MRARDIGRRAVQPWLDLGGNAFAEHAGHCVWLYTRASQRSRYPRFFTAGIPIDREVQRLVTPSDDHVALVVEYDGLAVGVASYEVLSSAQSEIAVLVDDAWQGDGIGSLLIEHYGAALALLTIESMGFLSP